MPDIPGLTVILVWLALMVVVSTVLYKIASTLREAFAEPKRT